VSTTATTSTPAPPGRAAGTAAIGGAVGFLVVMELGSGILQGWYPVLLKNIGAQFGASTASLNWVSAAYMLATVVCVPVIAKLGDRYGHKRMLTISATMVALGSVVVAVAPGFGVLLLGRALQAPLASFLPLEFAIVRDRDPERTGKSIGKLTGALTLGSAIGALGAGALLDVFDSLRATLWVPAVFMIICVPVVIFLVPESTARSRGRIDWTGATLLGVGLLLALGAVSNANTWGWSNPVTWIVMVIGLALLVVWFRVELRVDQPLIDMNVLLHGGIALPVVIAFLFGAQLFGAQTATTVFFMTDSGLTGYGMGLTSTVTGVIALATALAAFLFSSQGDRVAERISSRNTLMLGGALLAVNYVILIAGAHALPAIIIGQVIGGAGNGLLISVLPTIVVKRAPTDEVGIASAIYNTSRTAAGAVAGALFALVMSSFTGTFGSGDSAVTTTSLSGFTAVWAICGVIGLAVVALSLRITEPAAVTVVDSGTDTATRS
jgi:MFS family permease